MEQEDKKLLLIELFAKLPYGVKVCIKLPNHQKKIFEEQIGDLIELTRQGGYLVKSKGIDYRSFNLDIKPFLRSMSSMTEEEAKEISILYGIKDILSTKITDEYIEVVVDDNVCSTEKRTIWYNEIVSSIEILDWLNAHHFDYRGLISKGLALEASEEMYNLKVR